MSTRERVPCAECGVPGRSLKPEAYICLPCMKGEIAHALPPGRWEVRKGIQHFIPDPEPVPPPKIDRRLKPCGSGAAARRHRKLGEPVCEDCKKAERREQNERRRKLRARRKKSAKPFLVEQPRTYAADLLPHGTHAAFMRHRNDNEEPCDSCKYGERIYQRHAKRRSRDAARAAVENQQREAS